MVMQFVIKKFKYVGNKFYTKYISFFTLFKLHIILTLY